MSKISIIVAVAENGAIGKDQRLLWHLPNDLKLFKMLTTGHTIIMGRNTFESLPNGALPNRQNIVITSNRNRTYPGVSIAHSLPEALELCQDEEEAFIIGGSMVYNEALQFADTLYLTRVYHRFEDADTFFPDIDFSAWQMIKDEMHPVDEKHLYPYTFFTFERKKA
ncbi:dihydrofolate reductase [Parabacteroides sp. PF5-6]|uniref:dihydrofolate reductase n=1 Tax=Parabacteroides sp. PF5-6 TaxID=1742403 RepID=UPI0024075D39|nr:dihydrofolate reductase [Parabacteroides sp. PF5-6]MDF9831793.1 dihydrofolate reductase [Parabacteroides sp. PF5-6]